MKDSAIVEGLLKAMGQAAKAAKFCVDGCLPAVDPGIEVEGLGRVEVPLKRGKAKELIAHCRVAPYGKGTATLVDRGVRNTYELDPKKFTLSDEWDSAIVGATRLAAQQLGLPADRLEARLYKLLVYDRGGFFLKHRDSEKHDRMVASLIVVLPNPFEGGRLIVRHGSAEQALKFEESAGGKSACYAAFYADCEHEVERVHRGVRLCLAYNLVLKPQRGRASAAKPSAPADVLAESIRAWVATRPTEPMVFALEHHYTQRGLKLDLLKGADRQLADLVASAAQKADGLVHLAQVERHLSQFADDGSFERSYYRSYRPRRRELVIGETYEDELHGDEWVDLAGKKQPWGEVPFEVSSIVSTIPIDEWKPTSEEYEGYTGNAGNTLDRWYHRSAIVVWHRDHHFDVVAQAGADVSLPLFTSMVKKLAKTPKARLEKARLDCIRFARAIIAEWPRRWERHWDSPTEKASPYDDFPEHLLTLDDRDTVARFLSKVAEQDQTLSLSDFIVSACRRFGWAAFTEELKQLLSAPANVRGRDEIPFRDVEWLAAVCCDKSKDPDRLALAHTLCAVAVERFCAERPTQPAYYSRHRRESTTAEKSLPLLLKALVAAGEDEHLSRVIDHVQKSPDDFRVDDCQVPALKSLVPWSRKQLGSVPPPLASWLAAVRERLESATAIKPTPPTDWSRPADVACNCQYCAQLNTFLADPASKVGRIAAREDLRQHVLGMINRHQCDVTHTLDRKKSPYALVLTKTTGSYERAVKRYEADRKLLSALPPPV